MKILHFPRTPSAGKRSPQLTNTILNSIMTSTSKINLLSSPSRRSPPISLKRKKNQMIASILSLRRNALTILANPPSKSSLAFIPSMPKTKTFWKRTSKKSKMLKRFLSSQRKSKKWNTQKISKNKSLWKFQMNYSPKWRKRNFLSWKRLIPLKNK